MTISGTVTNLRLYLHRVKLKQFAYFFLCLLAGSTTVRTLNSALLSSFIVADLSGLHAFFRRNVTDHTLITITDSSVMSVTDVPFLNPYYFAELSHNPRYSQQLTLPLRTSPPPDGNLLQTGALFTMVLI